VAVLNGVGVLSVAKVHAAIMALVGLLIGLCIAILGGAASMFHPLAGVIGLAAIIVLPIVYAVMGFVMGAIVALLYNLVAGYVGGIELDLKK